MLLRLTLNGPHSCRSHFLIKHHLLSTKSHAFSEQPQGKLIFQSLGGRGVGWRQNSPSCQHFYPTVSPGLYLFYFCSPVVAHSIHWIPIWRRMRSRGHAIWTNLIGCQLQSDRHSTPVPRGYAQWHWLPSVVRPTRILGRWEGRGWPIWDCHFPSALASHLMTS